MVAIASGGVSPVTVLDGQEQTLNTPSGSWTLTTLFFRSGGNLPPGITVTFDLGNQIGSTAGDGTWEDSINGGTFDPVINGEFLFSNFSGGPITFWDIPPP